VSLPCVSMSWDIAIALLHPYTAHRQLTMQ